MHGLTFSAWKKISDLFYDKCLEHPLLLGSVDKDTCDEYLAFYALNKGLYWHEENGEITGIGTVHPGRKHLDWEWGQINGIWTLHCLWCETEQAMQQMALLFFQQHQPVEFYSCRRGKIVELSSSKIRKVFNYGRRRNNHSGGTATELRSVDERHLGGATQVCS